MGLNRKGDVTDILIFLIVMFILVIGFFILAYIVPQVTNGLGEAGLNNSAEGANAINSLSNFGTVGIQRGFFLLFVGLIMSTLITSFFSDTHPIFMFLYIFVLIITVFLGVYLGSAYQQMTSIEVFAQTLETQTIMNAVMNNILSIVIGVGVLSMIIVFAKFSSRGGGSGL